MNGELSPYPKYKDSGLPWLGQVPSHWKCLRCKYIFREVDERSELGEETHLSMSQTHGLIPSGDLDGKRLQSESYAGGKLCRVNDLVLNRLKAHLGVFAHATQAGVVSPDYTVLRPIHGDDVVFYELVFKTPDCTAELRRSTKGIVEGFWRLYTDDLYNIRVPVPPAEERQAILRFIKAMDAQVRKFIRNRRRLIDVLNEQKQAIVNQAVTRGIDPAIRLTPSGIGWLGNVPVGWAKQRLKFLVRNVNEQTGAKLPDDVYIALEHVESWTGRIALPAEDIAFESQVKRFRPDDVLFGKLRPYLAKVTRPQVPGVCVGEFLVLRVVDTGILPAFLEQKLRSSLFIDLINSSTFGAKMPRADWTFIGNLVVTYPPTHREQASILEAIGAQTASLQMAMDRARREIDLAREYRTRLIADVVVGRVDVRGCTPAGIEAGGAVPGSLDDDGDMEMPEKESEGVSALEAADAND